MKTKKSRRADAVSVTLIGTRLQQELLESLFHKHSLALKKFLRGRSGCCEPEDVIQEIFAKLAKRNDLKDKFGQDEKRNRAYMFTMANNIVVDIERSNSSRRRNEDVVQTHTLLVEDSSEGSPEVLAQALEDLEVMKMTLKKMNPNWSKAFMLNRFKNLTFPQVAEKMGVSVKTVEKYVRNALIELRRDLMDLQGGSSI
ncbi:sigma-70 family RNA polymerase sigma factor [Porticoccaceae bacterium LTM1]|nr:sigma-70 family RNA polymerase sigma factor [Porticoccaceae bacterium LTM1]